MSPPHLQHEKGQGHPCTKQPVGSQALRNLQRAVGSAYLIFPHIQEYNCCTFPINNERSLVCIFQKTKNSNIVVKQATLLYKRVTQKIMLENKLTNYAINYVNIQISAKANYYFFNHFQQQSTYIPPGLTEQSGYVFRTCITKPLEVKGMPSSFLNLSTRKHLRG